MEGSTNLVTEALANVTTIFTQAVNMVTGAPLAMAFIGMSLIGGGLGLFRSVIHTR